MIFSSVDSIVIPEGNVSKITRGTEVLWKLSDSLPSPGKVLNDYTWDEIKAISDAGKASEYFSVGDSKLIYLNGQTYTSTTYKQMVYDNLPIWVTIIGINHNADLEGAGIHFQINYPDDNGSPNISYPITLTSHMTSSSSSNYAYTMNTSATNIGGWKSSKMRTFNLDSDNPSPDNPSAYSILSLLPSELRSVLKSVTKYTDNAGGSSDVDMTTITATSDYLFLLSEYEVCGAISYSHPNESNYQMQYDYYKTHDLQRYAYNGQNSIGSTYAWWLRSPKVGVSSMFIWMAGNSSYGTNTLANYSRGISPCFVV